jgi:uncharacterized protein with HEPN domain
MGDEDDTVPQRDIVQIRQLLEAAWGARSFMIGRNRNDLDGDRMLQLALTRAIEIVGAIASRV